MGACDISFKMPGTPSFSAIKQQFKAQQERDSQYNGHQEGYSGDFQTVHDVKDHTHKVFDSYNEAHDYCLENSDKSSYVVAVRYRFVEKFTSSNKLQKLCQKIELLSKQLRELENKPVTLPKFVTCEGCQSKVSTKHLRGTKCPVCGEGDFRPLGLQRKLKKLSDKIKSLVTQSETLKKSEREKALKKSGKIGTLVAGWGAC